MQWTLLVGALAALTPFYGDPPETSSVRKTATPTQPILLTFATGAESKLGRKQFIPAQFIPGKFKQEQSRASGKLTPDVLQELIDGWPKKWSDQQWQKKFRDIDGYMRADDDSGWKYRMKVLQALVASGETALPVIERALDHSDAEIRALAAQALSFLSAGTDVKKWASRFAGESDAATRLYLADALGMSGQGEKIDWESLIESEQNRDVKMHLRYARDRGKTPVAQEVLEKLSRWGLDQMDSAVIGKPAPDFELKTLDGKKIRLSDYRGKRSVILVFIYGDT